MTTQEILNYRKEERRIIEGSLYKDEKSTRKKKDKNKEKRKEKEPYIRRTTKKDNKEDIKREKRIKQKYQEQKERIKKTQIEINAKIIGEGEIKKIEKSQKKNYIESSLPQYNLGEYFGIEQEKLYPIQKKTRHNLAHLDEKRDNNLQEPTIIQKSTQHVRYVYYKMIEEGEKEGVTSEIAIISLFYNYGIKLVKNIGRRANKYLNLMKTDKEFLTNIVKQYYNEKPNRDIKLLIRKYNFFNYNIKLKEQIISTLEKTINEIEKSTNLFNNNYSITDNNINTNSIQNYDIGILKLLIQKNINDWDNLQNERSLFLFNNPITNVFTSYSNFNLFVIFSNPISIDQIPSFPFTIIRDRLNTSSSNLIDTLSCFSISSNINLDDDILHYAFNDIIPARIVNEWSSDIPKLTSNLSPYLYNLDPTLLLHLSQILLITFTSLSDLNLFRSLSNLPCISFSYQTKISYPSLIFPSYSSAALSYLKRPTSSKPFSSSLFYSTYIAANNINSSLFSHLKKSIFDNLDRRYGYINVDNISQNSAYISKTQIFNLLCKSYSYDSLIEEISNNTISIILDEIRKPLFDIRINYLKSSASSKITKSTFL
ncbi:hypothetical protein EDI_285640 [Entamoeba dispar SAW760]|uniref:Uncharacterized protein n=1 Tax=Entamoeba dispar (strain ATCC PRA-260 / SAW760) TaxID=370354 RepID=B0E756_ENTDS|nr:uncharacterized protein EDI_285640 [Entamoeba dispar SAW760]EDR29627.1 hypothetical protein EDI_285640 [Entamoeba dispar SAW760]|eukprot:EDR29627.1 hypothetical protein EDI_285640 [Entamoeba dispar SAW760]